MESLLAENASFQDLTAGTLFGAVAHLGKPAILKLFREGFADVPQMKFRPHLLTSSGNYAIFEVA